MKLILKITTFLLLSISSFTINAQQKMYWTSLDGIFQTDLWSNSQKAILTPHKPLNFALNTQDNKFYFTDEAKKAIYKCDKDGNNLTIHKAGLTSPTDIYYNKKENLLYYIDGNAIIKLNADNTQQIILSNLVSPYSLTMDETLDKIYWSDIKNNTISVVNSNGTQNKVILNDLSNAQDLAFSDNVLYYLEYCGATICSGISKANPDGTGVKKISDAFAANMAVQGNFVYYTNNTSLNAIERISTSGSGKKIIFDEDKLNLNGLYIDATDDKVYGLGHYGKLLYSVGLSQPSFEASILLVDKIAAPQNITFDSLNMKMIWINGSYYGNDNPAIMRSNYDGTNMEVLYAKKDRPTWYLEIDRKNKKIIWSDYDGVHRSDLDGKNPEDIIPSLQASNFVVDAKNNRLVMSLYFDRKIVAYDLDGKNKKIIKEKVGSPGIIALDNSSNIYWYDYNKYDINKMTSEGKDSTLVLDSNGFTSYSSIFIDNTNSKIFLGSEDKIEYVGLNGTNLKDVKIFRRYSYIRGLVLNNVKTTDLKDNFNSLENIKIDIFPNPVSSILNIKCEANYSGKATLYDLQGKAISQFEVKDGAAILNCEPLSQGMYNLFILWENNQISSQKIIVDK